MEKINAVMHTNLGDINLELFPNQAPVTVKNFVELAKGEREWKNPATGKTAKEPLYDGTLFHRVIGGFMIQGGDPLGSGMGGPGYTFDDEISELTFSESYLLAMANAGKRTNPVTGKLSGTNGSQFFITTVPTPHLNGKHTIFGKVADDDSKKIVDKISATPTNPSDKPLKNVVLESITFTEDAL
ncbi:MAG: peptidylprolyl isomerase [Bifidobacteriaceae bacterium]|jgi:peptidyl-prolyl cis-trans isomerase A (cyclophilin A)|nr:peptidylprolyl isomerase [Bifidobacteriaceae bacterium]